MNTAKQMILASKECGADAVKFQAYDSEEIRQYEREHPPSKYTEQIFEGIKKTQFSPYQLADLKTFCDSVGIEFMVTPFLYPRRIEELNGLVKRWKIRERDSTNNELIEAALRTTKDVLISVQSLPLDLDMIYDPQIKWLYCIPKYPAVMDDLDLTMLSVASGYSNHVPKLAAPMMAVAYAVEARRPEWYLEVHVTLKHGMGVLDEAVSFDFSELKTLVDFMRTVEAWKLPE